MIEVHNPRNNDTIILNDEQENLVRTAVREIHSGASLVQYAAPAGCGKSLVLRAIVNELGLSDDEIIPMAYTGSASMIMRKNGFTTAKTCHSWIYAPKIEKQYDYESNKYIDRIKYTRRNLDRSQYKLCLIDEASMVPRDIRRDIEKNRIPVIACGDLDQLPPVNGDSAYLGHGTGVYRLTKIMRQKNMSSIILLSDMLRKGIIPPIGDYGDVLVIPYSMLTKEQLINAEVVICGFNNTRDILTNFIRSELGYRTPLPCPGEKVVCRENNWDLCVCNGDENVNLVNGLMGTCISNDGSISRMKGRNIFTMDFVPKMFPDFAFLDVPCDYTYFTSNYMERRGIREFERTHPKMRRFNKFEFGYAITTHMSQGNQYNSGIFLMEPFRSDQNKINYTGITRFIDHCIFVVPDSGNKCLPPPGLVRPLSKCVMYINNQPQI